VNLLLVMLVPLLCLSCSSSGFSPGESVRKISGKNEKKSKSVNADTSGDNMVGADNVVSDAEIKAQGASISDATSASSDDADIEDGDEASLPENIAGAYLHLYEIQKPTPEKPEGIFGLRLQNASGEKLPDPEDIKISQNSLGVKNQIIAEPKSSSYHSRIRLFGSSLENIAKVMQQALITYVAADGQWASVRGLDNAEEPFAEDRSEPYDGP